MLLGLDFDNTLISYGELFHKLASEEQMIPKNIPMEKNAVRDYLRQHDYEVVWTRLQGEVYGNRILEALPWEGMQTALRQLQDRGVRMCLVSHKTRTPYLGPAYDLHSAARSWLEAQGFFSQEGLAWSSDQVFFEVTMEEKLHRIQKLGCTYYLDDLPEILELLPKSIGCIHFDPQTKPFSIKRWPTIRMWSELPALIL